MTEDPERETFGHFTGITLCPCCGMRANIQAYCARTALTREHNMNFSPFISSQTYVMPVVAGRRTPDLTGMVHMSSCTLGDVVASHNTSRISLTGS